MDPDLGGPKHVDPVDPDPQHCLVGIVTPPPTHSPANECTSPRNQRVGGWEGDTHSPACDVVGESQFGRLERKLSTLSTLCCMRSDRTFIISQLSSRVVSDKRIKNAPPPPQLPGKEKNFHVFSRGGYSLQWALWRSNKNYKKNFFSFFWLIFYYTVTPFTPVFKDNRTLRSHKTVEIKVLYCLACGRIRIRENNYRSGSRRPKILRIPIRNTGIMQGFGSGSALVWVAGSGSGPAFKLRIRIRIQEGENDPQK
jgi:hypothetical protein